MFTTVTLFSDKDTWQSTHRALEPGRTAELPGSQSGKGSAQQVQSGGSKRRYQLRDLGADFGVVLETKLPGTHSREDVIDQDANSFRVTSHPSLYSIHIRSLAPGIDSRADGRRTDYGLVRTDDGLLRTDDGIERTDGKRIQSPRRLILTPRSSDQGRPSHENMTPAQFVQPYNQGYIPCSIPYTGFIQVVNNQKPMTTTVSWPGGDLSNNNGNASKRASQRADVIRFRCTHDAEHGAVITRKRTRLSVSRSMPDPKRKLIERG
ncbi:hypothetical protein PG996_004182 [Apiospora saccharicola]|uniref:Uncharacterized protein n=1 Tax=Apiospora saccharicola TaxID=335842 RepID=A0ABR1W3K3_9PEZI